MENIKVNLAVVFAFLLQGGGLVYWAAQQAATLDQLSVTVSKLESNIADGQLITIRRDIQDLQKELDKLKADHGNYVAGVNEALDTHWREINNSVTYPDLEKLRNDLQFELDELKQKIENMSPEN